MPRRFQLDDRAISAQIAVVLMVGVVVVVAVAVILLTNQFANDQKEVQQKITFAVTSSNSGGRLEVQTVPGGPLSWAQLRLGGTATCTAPVGEVRGGDAIVCTSLGSVTIVDTADETLVFSWDFR